MAKKSKTLASKRKTDETDGVYFLKLVLYLVLGSQWLWFTKDGDITLSLPIGLVLGLGFAIHDHFKIDRKIEFALLLVAMIIGFMGRIGIYYSL